VMVEQISGSSLVLVFLDYCMVNIDPAPLQILSSSSVAWRAGVRCAIFAIRVVLASNYIPRLYGCPVATVCRN